MNHPGDHDAFLLVWVWKRSWGTAGMGAGSGEHPLLSTAVLRARANDLVAPCCNFYGNTPSLQDESCICNVTHISKKEKKIIIIIVHACMGTDTKCLVEISN